MWGGLAPSPRRRSATPWVIGAIAAALVVIVLLTAITNAVTSTGRPRTTNVAPYPLFDDSPPTTDDHWHWAYGVYVCDRFLEPLVDDGEDYTGIHTHEDGVIHIHPFDTYVSGSQARLDVFLETVGATASTSSIRVLDPRTGAGKTYQTCNGATGTVKATIWDLDAEGTPSHTVTGDINEIHFDKDRQAITIGLVEAGTELPKPESIPKLDELTDVPTRRLPSTTTTRAPGTTRRPGSTTTTEATTTTDATTASTGG